MKDVYRCVNIQIKQQNFVNCENKKITLENSDSFNKLIFENRTGLCHTFTFEIKNVMYLIDIIKNAYLFSILAQTESINGLTTLEKQKLIISFINTFKCEVKKNSDESKNKESSKEESNEEENSEENSKEESSEEESNKENNLNFCGKWIQGKGNVSDNESDDKTVMSDVVLENPLNLQLTENDLKESFYKNKNISFDIEFKYIVQDREYYGCCGIDPEMCNQIYNEHLENSWRKRLSKGKYSKLKIDDNIQNKIEIFNISSNYNTITGSITCNTRKYNFNHASCQCHLYWGESYDEKTTETTAIDLFATFTIDIHNNKLYIHLVPEIMM